MGITDQDGGSTYGTDRSTKQMGPLSQSKVSLALEIKAHDQH